MQSQKSFEFFEERVTIQRVLVQSGNNFFGKDNRTKQGPSIIRDDVFLIKVTVNDIKVQNQFYQEIKPVKELTLIKQKLAEQLQLAKSKFPKQTSEVLNFLKQAQQFANQLINYQENKFVNGDVSLRIVQSEPIYLSPKLFIQKYSEHIKTNDLTIFTDSISNPNDINFAKTITNAIPTKLSQFAGTFRPDTDNQQQKIKHKASQSMSKLSRHSLFKMILSSFHAANPHQKDKQSFKFYQQFYNLIYKRKIPIQKQKQKSGNNKISQKQEAQGIFYQQDDMETQQMQIYEARPNLQRLFQKKDSMMFTGTEKSLFQIKFEENDINQAIDYLNVQQSFEEKKRLVKNVFSAKFKLQEMCEIPFIEHQITVSLDHRLRIDEGELKYIDKNKKIKFIVNMSLFIVPGNVKSGWGNFKIEQMKADLRQIFGSYKQKSYVKIKIEFPDVMLRNKCMKNPEQQKIQTKAISLEQRQNPFWPEDMLIKISPQKNNMRIRLIQLKSKNIDDEKLIIAEKTINFLEEGFLIDRIPSSKNIKLESKESQKFVNLTMNFNFELTLNNDEIVTEKHVSEKPNAFINHLAFL